MARILLVLPHLPQRMGAPYLGQQYIAASLLQAGHEVRCVDQAAVLWDGTDEDIVDVARTYQPDMIGMTLFTYNAHRGYLLAAKLRSYTRMVVAGGPHPTVLPREPLEYGFDVSVSGEGEFVVQKLAAFLDGSFEDDLASIPGVYLQGGLGCVRESIENLDDVALPLESYTCYDPGWYSPAQLIVPGGLMTSRGCPARCTFCANYVTGRAYRWRSAENVVREMVRLKTEYSVNHFPFWDDAFTARRPRLNELCDAILAEPALRGATWTCITPGNMVKPRDLVRMRKAGCVSINFGIESGDFNVLKAIRKGQKPQQVRDAVAAAKQEGMSTVVNFMFGFPAEGEQELKNTLQFMKELSEHTDFFNNRGVLVPFPGTTIYDVNHEKYGFTKWWLNPEMIPDEPNLFVLEPRKAQKYLETDPTLDLDFFHYTPEVRALIAECVRFKGLHNQRALEKITAQSRTAYNRARESRDAVVA